MKIKLTDVDRESRVEFNFSVSNLEGISLEGELQVSGTARKLNNEYFIEGKYLAKIKTQCVRCLEDLVVDMGEKSFHGKYLNSQDYERYMDSLSENSTAEMTEEEYFEAPNGEIDVTELVREEILLEMPQYPACVPECKDDSYLQKYSNDGMDSRWAQLLDIKIKN